MWLLYWQLVRRWIFEVRYVVLSSISSVVFLSVPLFTIDVFPIAASVHSLRDDLGKSALQTAANYGHTDAMEALWTYGATTIPVDGETLTELHLAAQGGHVQAVKFLLDHGVDIEARCNGRTAPHIAARYGQKEVLEILLAAGAILEAPGPEGTALQLALKHEFKDSAKILQTAGAQTTSPSRLLRRMGLKDARRQVSHPSTR